MSPRRRIEPGSPDFLAAPPSPRRRWQRATVLSVTGVCAAVLAALVVCSLVFVHSQQERRAAIRDVAVIDFVRSFVIQYTSPDPFNANGYADRVLAQGTGEFAKLYSERMNEVVLQVARTEPGIGTVEDGAVGISRWNDDGSASVVAVANTTTTMPDGKKIQSATRWVVRAIKEGEQWKVSNLMQVL